MRKQNRIYFIHFFNGRQIHRRTVTFENSTWNGIDGIVRKSINCFWQLSTISSRWHTCHNPRRPAFSESKSPTHSEGCKERSIGEIRNWYGLRTTTMMTCQVLTGCEKCNRTDDRIAYCEYCPEHGNCLWISNIICRMQMIRVNVFYFSSHDCFNTGSWWWCWCGSCCSNPPICMLDVSYTIFDWFALTLGLRRVLTQAERDGKDRNEWTIHSHSSTPLTLDSHAN